MKNILVILIVSMTFLLGCNKSPKCWGKRIVNKGEIITDTTICNNCTMISDQEDQFVITAESGLNDLRSYLHGNNGVCILNSFDFSRYSILGVNSKVTCNYKVKRDVTIDENNKTYLYTLTIRECGKCIEQNYIQNWVLVPKIKAGYGVSFVIQRK